MAVPVPVKEQAIVLDYVNGISDQEYVTAIGQIIDPKNIEFVSIRADNLVHIFLNSTEMVDELITGDTKVIIGGHELKIQPLIPRSIRMILSNVCPIIPSCIIEKKLAESNVKPISQITFIKQNINNPNYAHIYGSDREMYIRLEDVSKLSKTLEIKYDDKDYSIQLTPDIIRCKKEHIIENTEVRMPTGIISNIKEEKNNEEVPISNSTLSPQPSTSTAHEVIIKPNNLENISSLKKEKKAMESKSRLRYIKEKASAKLIKQEISQQLQPTKNFIMKYSTEYNINYQSIKKLIFDTYYHSNIREIAAIYTKDIRKLVDLLLNIKEKSKKRSFKNRISKIIQHLEHKRNFYPVKIAN